MFNNFVKRKFTLFKNCKKAALNKSIQLAFVEIKSVINL